MRCPFCSEAETRVMDSRESAEGAVIRRRRECESCKRRFTTYERVEEQFPLVVKKDGRREAYERQKLLHGLVKACEKRPVSREQLDALVTGVERTLQGLGEREVPSAALGEMVMERLSALDEVAYVRFASVYRSFRDIADLMGELETLIKAQGQKRTKGKEKEKP